LNRLDAKDAKFQDNRASKLGDLGVLAVNFAYERKSRVPSGTASALFPA
jgi:hypothetical protein